MDDERAPLGITGSTGKLGGRVAQRLAARGVKQRLLVRDTSRAPELPNAEVVEASYDKVDDVAAALAGLETVLMVSAAEHPDRLAQHYAFVDGARRAGVRQVVYTSFAGAAADAVFTLGRDHFHTEQYLRQSGLGWTFLRDNLYADFVPLMVGDDGAIRGPAGDGVVALVARDDIADVAVTVLTDPGAHASATYNLTGPEALTVARVAEIMTEVTGRAVRYHEETVPEAYASRAHYQAPDWQLDAWVSTYTAIGAGEVAAVSSDIERLTGHPATPLRAVLHGTPPPPS